MVCSKERPALSGFFYYGAADIQVTQLPFLIHAQIRILHAFLMRFSEKTVSGVTLVCPLVDF